MVSILLFFMLFAAQQVKMSAEVEESQAIAGGPVPAVITIEHPKEAEVDPKSFQIESKPLEVTLLRSFQVTPPAPLMLSYYQFELEAKTAGLYHLPAISATVGGEKYQSLPVSYEVVATKKSSEKVEKPLLRLEPFVEGSKAFYPGEKRRVGYRYYFTYSVELTREDIPLLEAEGLEKIGEPNLRSAQEGDLQVVEASQAIEGTTVGTYSYGPSVIEGKPYTMNSSGQKIYGQILTSTVPEVVLEVLPFPEKNKPSSFTGAVGKYSFQTKLSSPKKASVGDLMTLQITVKGEGDIDTVVLPELCCQPGMEGFFETSDIPSVGTKQEGQKVFSVDLRPLTIEAKQIPSLEFSFFNPETKKYVVQKSDPIPVQIVAPIENKTPEIKDAKEPEKRVLPIEIETVYQLKDEDLGSRPFGTWWNLIWAAVLVFLFFIQWQWKNYLDERRKNQPRITSSSLYKKMEKTQERSAKWYRLVNEMFSVRLQELGKSGSSSVDKLLQDLQRERYSQSGEEVPLERIKKTFGELQ